MFNRKLWSEAVDIAKDQARHGKVHYSDLQKVTETIYKDLLELDHGPAYEANTILASSNQMALPAVPVGKFKHEYVDGKVRCAVCGKTFKSITIVHLKSHGINSREEYMQKYGVANEDMTGDIKRTVLKGDNNPLKISDYIMKEYKVARSEVSNFIAENGFKDLKDLMKQAKDAGVMPFEFFKDKKDKSLL
ncbi:MucR family transcriptional regulator [Solidesulfovibrio sp. C21]|uniref:MucR family transcriptional regulator n=1 Tax=Solidesulfovibrio sp. C21 TaxID=3398613 RepID=UPI0039FD67B4